MLSYDWSEGQRRALSEASSGDGRHARRARHLLDTEGLSDAEAACRSGVSRATLTRWRRRFEAGGVVALHDAGRGGRPSTMLDEAALIRAVLDPTHSAPATRDLARRLGVSQTIVVRTLGRLFAPEDDASPLWSGRRTSIAAFSVSAEATVLVLRRTPANIAPTIGPSTVRSWQRLLLMDRLRTRLEKGPTTLNDFLLEVRERHGASALIELSSNDFQTGRPPGNAQAWLGLRDSLVKHVEPDELVPLLRAAQAWLLSERTTAFTWMAPPPAQADFEMTAAGGLAHTLVLVLRDAIRRQELAPEQRFSTSWVATRAGTSGAATRQALTRLREDGVVRRVHDRGYAVVSPRQQDVLEVYAARRALGGMLVGRLASAGCALDHASIALEHMRRTAAEGGTWCSEDADLRFQDALAHDAGSDRMATMFHRLTDQLRLFIAALGVRYGYAPAAALADNVAIFQAARRQDRESTVAAWQQKMSRAAGYMVHQLPPVERPSSRH